MVVHDRLCIVKNVAALRFVCDQLVQQQHFFVDKRIFDRLRIGNQGALTNVDYGSVTEAFRALDQRVRERYVVFNGDRYV